MIAKETPSALDTSVPVARVAAGFCILLSLVGVGVGLHLTRLKFQMDYTPCLSAYGGCRVGTMTCDDALQSSMSTLVGLPLSLWCAGFYAATAMLAGAALRRGAFGGTAAHLLVVMSGFSVLVSAVLGSYTAAVLANPCPFCMTLYAVSGLLLLGALLVWRAPGGEHVAFRELRRARLADALDGLFALLLVLVVATGVQSLGYHGLRNRVDAQDGCPESVEALPTPTIRVGVDDPQVILALFLDMTCPKCRSEFKKLGTALQGDQFPARVQLWVFHTPRQACDPEAFPAGYPSADDGARFDNACMAARAAECMEKLQAGAGFRLISGMFALHDMRVEGEPLFTAERIGSRAVELDMEIDPDDADNALFRCINHDRDVLDRITAHQRYTDKPGFTVPTLLIYPAVAGGPDLSRKRLVANANVSLATIMEYVSRQATAAAQP